MVHWRHPIVYEDFVSSVKEIQRQKSCISFGGECIIPVINRGWEEEIIP